MYRLFVAVDLPPEIRRSLAALAGNLPGARWVPEEQLHLTLRFIGEVDEGTFHLIRDALGRIEGRSFPLALGRIGHFPTARQPRVVWVGMQHCPLLLALQARVEEAVRQGGIPPEERRFSPHITLARLKETPAQQVAAFETRHAGFATAPFTVDEFYLYTSRLTRDGAAHRREVTYRLQ